MTSRRQVDSLTSAQTNVTAQAKRELGQIWMEVQTLPEERRRDALLDLIPALVDKYGDVSGSVAADWYDQIRAAWLESEQLPGDDYHAVAATNPYNASDLHREIIYQLNAAIDGDDMDHVLDRLNARLDKWIRQAGRDTIISSTANDPRRPRYARVPKGRTCAFCAMLASRGFVYASAETAGSFRKYHDQCDCEIVPSWDAERISGYDPDALYADYLKARDETGKLSPTDSEVLAAMRRHAGQYTDSAGVHGLPYPRIQGDHSIEACSATTNPNYATGRVEWRYNCQRCVGAYELRRRGYDVTAKPRPTTASGHLDKNDRMPYMTDEYGWPHMFRDTKLENIAGTTGRAVRTRIMQRMSEYGDGARAIVRVRWNRRNGGGGHVFIAEQDGDTTRFIDPQTGNVDCSDYFQLIMPKGWTYIMRIDDKEPTELIDKAVSANE